MAWRVESNKTHSTNKENSEIGRHTLSIPNPSFLGFDADAASKSEPSYDSFE